MDNVNDEKKIIFHRCKSHKGGGNVSIPLSSRCKLQIVERQKLFLVDFKFDDKDLTGEKDFHKILHAASRKSFNIRNFILFFTCLKNIYHFILYYI